MKLLLRKAGDPVKPHEVHIHVEQRDDGPRAVALCTCGWRSTGKGRKGEERVSRKADDHLRKAHP